MDSELFKSKSKLINKTNNAGIIDAEITVPLKYPSFLKEIE